MLGWSQCWRQGWVLEEAIEQAFAHREFSQLCAHEIARFQHSPHTFPHAHTRLCTCLSTGVDNYRRVTRRMHYPIPNEDRIALN